MNFLNDYLGNKSNGRMLSCICVFFAFICHQQGYVYPNLASHAQAGVVAFLGASAVFYGVAKVPETVSANKQGDKDV